MNSFTATVATRPRATRPARTPPAMSTCDMIQPPKMSPFWFASAGIGMTRSVACLPSGSFSMLQIMQGPAAEWCETRPEDEAGVGELRRSHRHAEFDHRRVKRLGLRALLDQAKSVLHVRAEHAVHQESR